MRLLILYISFMLPLIAWSQNDAQIAESTTVLPVSEDKDSVRRYNIKGFPDYFFVYPVLKQRSLNFELARRGGSSVLTYRPNNTYNLGMGVYLFELGLEFSFAIPLQQQSIDRFGESEARDLHLNVLTKRWGVDALY